MSYDMLIAGWPKLYSVDISKMTGEALGIYDGVDDGATPDKKRLSNYDTKELESMSGLSKHQIEQVIRFTQNQHQKSKNGNKNLEEDPSISTLSIIKLMIMLGLLSALIYFMNRDYNDAVTVWFVRSFPRESATFGLSLRNEL